MDQKNMIDISVPYGTTILQAAKELGIHIPTLCYHPALPLYASCRVCLVEISIEKGGRTRSWIDTSCAYPIQNPIKVQTNTEKVRKERKIIIELLLSRAPDSKILNELAEEYGAEKGKFQTLDKGESNCILCGLCVRVCNEMIHSNAIGTAYRGIHKKVVTPYGIAKELCVGCLACVYVCPTGAIKAKIGVDKLELENWEAELEMKLCRECGKPIGPRVYLERIRKEVNLRDHIFDLCTECRRKEFRKTYGIGYI